MTQNIATTHHSGSCPPASNWSVQAWCPALVSSWMPSLDPREPHRAIIEGSTTAYAKDADNFSHCHTWRRSLPLLANRALPLGNETQGSGHRHHGETMAGTYAQRVWIKAADIGIYGGEYSPHPPDPKILCSPPRVDRHGGREALDLYRWSNCNNLRMASWHPWGSRQHCYAGRCFLRSREEK
jgi:hypothetical protein